MGKTPIFWIRFFLKAQSSKPAEIQKSQDGVPAYSKFLAYGFAIKQSLSQLRVSGGFSPHFL
ncbi:hypothetical protein TREAZ_2253 [Leadbettera azotonutricia ZAS-9]|uniref:Uncharacterized protein n=1 Tax=Leadbettera azotonutricia (strain ATCC BAA-888 / DSM 13862 / ZAS-9) TaxID=545695 RepID=F5Y852_LEAAZ|nr:hypothetical protein TREAZ_2253 [Leadbettera azotonutricia ZAS-9]